MCDPARQLAHRFHLLGLTELLFALPELLFGPFALGDVPNKSKDEIFTP